jgi:hypothetical protein
MASQVSLTLDMALDPPLTGGVPPNSIAMDSPNGEAAQ